MTDEQKKEKAIEEKDSITINEVEKVEDEQIDDYDDIFVEE